MQEYKSLAAAIIKEAIEDVRELRRLKLFMAPAEFGPLVRVTASEITRRHIYEVRMVCGNPVRRKRTPSERRKYVTRKFYLAGLFDSGVSRKVLNNIIADPRLVEYQQIPKWVNYASAVSAVRFFDSQWFLMLAQFSGIDASCAKRIALISCTDEDSPPATPAHDEEWCDQQSSENPETA